jgi:acyl-CoA thioester hydrolase
VSQTGYDIHADRRRMTTPFRYLLRVRFQEVDAQGVVFNARWVDYIDIAMAEYGRIVFGSVLPAETGVDWRLVKQTVEWKAAGRYDDVLEARIWTVKVGTSSFTLAFEFRRHGSEAVLVTAETVYVRVDVAANASKPLDDHHRVALERGAPGIVVDHAGAPRLP